MNTQTYLQFHSYNCLSKNPKLTEMLVHAYQDVFGDPKLWNEHYSSEQVLASLQSGLTGKAGIRLCLAEQKLMAFCWAQQLHINAIEEAVLSIDYVRQHGGADPGDMLRKVIGDKAVIYLHDLGISQQHRGKVSLSELICPLLSELAGRCQNNRLFFWSIADSRVFRLAERAGFDMVADINGLQFFYGDLNNRKLQNLAIFRH